MTFPHGPTHPPATTHLAPAERGLDGAGLLAFGLWVCLVAGAVTHLMTLLLAERASTGDADLDAAFLLLPATSRVAAAGMLLGGVAAVLGARRARRASGDRSASLRVLLALAQVAIGLLVARHVLAGGMLIAAQQGWRAVGSELDAVYAVYSWLWYAAEAASPLLAIALHLGTRRLAAARAGRPATVPLVLGIVAGLARAGAGAVVGLDRELGDEFYWLLAILIVVSQALVFATLVRAVRRAAGRPEPRRADTAEIAARSSAWERAESGVRLLTSGLFGRVLSGMAAGFGVACARAAVSPAVAGGFQALALVVSVASFAAMAAGASRLRSAPEPTRAAGLGATAAAILFAVCLAADGFLLWRVCLSLIGAGGLDAAVLSQLRVVTTVALVTSLVGYLALVASFKAIASRFGAAGVSGRAASLTGALVAAVGGAAILWESWPLLLIAGAKQERVVVALIAAWSAALLTILFLGLMARGLSLRMRRAMLDAPDLAPAVARMPDRGGANPFARWPSS